MDRESPIREADASGKRVGSELQVNTYTSGHQYNASVAVAPTGDFVVVWRSGGSTGTDTDRGSIQGQRYDYAGVPQRGEFQVNTYTTGYQFDPDVAVYA
jgi:large repetitive protein